MKNHVIFFSGGKSSFTVAHLVKERYPDDNIVLYFTDTKWEDEDLYRFINEASDKLHLPMLTQSMGINPIQLMFKQKVLFNSRIGQCSTILKMKTAADFLKKNKRPAIHEWHNEQYLKAPFEPSQEGFAENTTLYFGIGWDEAHREGPIRKNWQPFSVDMPLIEEVIDNEGVLKLYDIRRPSLYDKGFVHNNCFAGSERFLTYEGIKTFKETVGQKVKVVGLYSNWQDAEIKSFGEQQIVELVITKNTQEKVIRTTAGHRWFVRKSRKNQVEKTTDELQKGDALWGLHLKPPSIKVKPSPIGIAQGIVFGDGTYPKNTWNNPATVTLCGDKVELLKYFPLQDVKEVNGIGMKVCDLPKSWKHKPDLNESKSFLLGWLLGYLSTDGSINKHAISLSSSKKEDLEFVQKLCLKVGITFYDIHNRPRKGIDGKISDLYTMSFAKSSFRKEWMIRQKHKEGFCDDPKTRPSEWRVKEVRVTNEFEEVFCAVVPNGQRFVLEGNILTGNCRGRCVKAGQGHFKNLYEKDPELFQEYKAQEHHLKNYVSAYHYIKKLDVYGFDDDVKQVYFEDLDNCYRDYFNGAAKKPKVFVPPDLHDKKYSFMKRSKNGKSEPYQLRDLEQDILEDAKQLDLFDIGGCSCFVDYSNMDAAEKAAEEMGL